MAKNQIISHIINNPDLIELVKSKDKKDRENAKSLIKNGANVNSKDEGGWTLLMYCVINNNVDLARLLIKNNVNINANQEDGITALIFAVIFGNYEFTKLLIENGADVNTKIKDSQFYEGMTALTFASRKNNQKIVKLLLQQDDIKISLDVLEKHSDIRLLNDHKNLAEKIFKNENIDIVFSKLQSKYQIDYNFVFVCLMEKIKIKTKKYNYAELTEYLEVFLSINLQNSKLYRVKKLVKKYYKEINEKIENFNVDFSSFITRFTDLTPAPIEKLIENNEIDSEEFLQLVNFYTEYSNPIELYDENGQVKSLNVLKYVLLQTNFILINCILKDNKFKSIIMESDGYDQLKSEIQSLKRSIKEISQNMGWDIDSFVQQISDLDDSEAGVLSNIGENISYE